MEPYGCLTPTADVHITSLPQGLGLPTNGKDSTSTQTIWNCFGHHRQFLISLPTWHSNSSPTILNPGNLVHILPETLAVFTRLKKPNKGKQLNETTQVATTVTTRALLHPKLSCPPITKSNNNAQGTTGIPLLGASANSSQAAGLLVTMVSLDTARKTPLRMPSDGEVLDVDTNGSIIHGLYFPHSLFYSQILKAVATSHRELSNIVFSNKGISETWLC